MAGSEISAETAASRIASPAGRADVHAGPAHLGEGRGSPQSTERGSQTADDVGQSTQKMGRPDGRPIFVSCRSIDQFFRLRAVFLRHRCCWALTGAESVGRSNFIRSTHLLIHIADAPL